MKKKMIIGSITGAIVLGGAFSVSAMSGEDNWSNEKVKISQEKAESIAKKEVKDLTIENVEKDEDDGVFHYEIDGRTEDGKKTDIDVNANTGDVLKVDRENDDADDNPSNSVENLKVTKEEAEKIAKEKAAGEVVELEIDDGHYDLELNDGKHEYEVTVHGQSGEIIELEKNEE